LAAAVLGLGLAAWLGGYAGAGSESPMLAELKTIVVPPPPPPHTDPNTVDLSDKKGPLIPRIPSVVLGTRGAMGEMAKMLPDNRTIFNPEPPLPPIV
jgi:hypothetical protein